MILGREASFALGLGFSILNFWMLTRIVVGLTGGVANSQQVEESPRWGVRGGESGFAPRLEPQHPALPVQGGLKTGLFFFGKMGLLFTIIGLILWKSYASPLPFVTGFSLGLIGGICFMFIKGRVKDA